MEPEPGTPALSRAPPEDVQGQGMMIYSTLKRHSSPSTNNHLYAEQAFQERRSSLETTKRHPYSTTVRVIETVIVTVTVAGGGEDGQASLSSETTGPLNLEEAETGGVRGHHFMSDGDASLPASTTSAPASGPITQTIHMISASGGAFLGSMGSIGRMTQRPICCFFLSHLPALPGYVANRGPWLHG